MSPITARGAAMLTAGLLLAGCVSVRPAEPCTADSRQGRHGRHGVLGFELEMNRAQAEATCERGRGRWDDGWCELPGPGGQRVRVRADLERDPPLSVRPVRFAGVQRVRAQLERELEATLGPPWPGSSQERALYPLERPGAQTAEPSDCTQVVEVPAIAVHGVDGGGFDVSWSEVSWEQPAPPEHCFGPVDEWDLSDEEEPAPVDLRVGLGLGHQGSADELAGPAFTVSAEVSRALTDWLQVGARGAWITGGDAGEDADDDGEDDSDRTNPHSLLGTVEIGATLWSDGGVDGGHHGWRLGVGGGYHHGLTDLASSGPTVGAHLARVVTHPSLVSVALVARYDRTFTDGEDYQLVTVAAEMGSPLRNEEHRDRWEPSFPYLFGAHLTVLGFNAHPVTGFIPPGVGITVGLPLGALLDVRARVDTLALPGAGADGVISYSAVAGGRLRLDDLWPVFVEALGGWALTFGTEPRDIGDGPVLDVGVGIQALDLGGVGRYPPVPDLGLELALRFRAGLDQTTEPLRAILLAVAIQYGSRAGSLGGHVQPRRLCF